MLLLAAAFLAGLFLSAALFRAKLHALEAAYDRQQRHVHALYARLDLVRAYARYQRFGRLGPPPGLLLGPELARLQRFIGYDE